MKSNQSHGASKTPRPENTRDNLADVLPLDPIGLPIFEGGASWPAYSWEFDDESDRVPEEDGSEAYYADRGEG